MNTEIPTELAPIIDHLFPENIDQMDNGNKINKYVRKNGLNNLYKLLKYVKNINLSKLEDPIGDAGAKIVAEQLNHNDRLISLNIGHLNISEVGMIEIFKAIKHIKTLQKLEIPGYQYNSDKSIDHIFSFIKDTNITELNLSRGTGKYINNGELVKIYDCLQQNTNLKILYLSCNQINVRLDPNQLTKVLQNNIHLTKLDLSDNELTDLGGNYLAVMLKNNSTLIDLNLYNTLISDDGVKNISESLKQNRTLTNLNLSNNRISDVGMKYLADCIKVNDILSTINLQNNVGTKEWIEYCRTQFANSLFYTKIDIITDVINSKVDRNIYYKYTINDTIIIENKPKEISPVIVVNHQQEIIPQLESQDVIYVLLLEQDKYYVGRTNDISRRILEHKNNTLKAAEFTKKYKVISLIEISPCRSDFDEDNKTKQYMMTYGIENVRGGTYCQIELTYNTRKVLENEFKHLKNECYRCCSTNHYTNQCPQRY